MSRDRGSVKPAQKSGDWSIVTATPRTGDHQTIKVPDPNSDWSSAKPDGPVRDPSCVTTTPSNTGDHQTVTAGPRRSEPTLDSWDQGGYGNNPR